MTPMNTAPVVARLEAIRDEMLAELRSEMGECAEEVLETAEGEAPFLTGALSRSGSTDVSGSGANIVAAIGFRDNKAVIAHENLTDRHPFGKKAKFLENPLNAYAGRYVNRLGDVARRVIG